MFFCSGCCDACTLASSNCILDALCATSRSAKDHHYHFGYFVVTAAILAKLKPDWKNKTDFVEFVSLSAWFNGT